MTNEGRKLNYEEFFKTAILKLRNTSKSRGIHSVFTGFNEAFRKYFDEDPVKIAQELAGKGKIEIRPVKKGVMLYLPDEAPESRASRGDTALSKILNQPPKHDKGLVEEVLSEVVPEGIKAFPEDFLEQDLKVQEMREIELPGTPLQLNTNFQTTVISPRGHFRYKAKNPSEAKYIIYAHNIGQRKINIPKNNRVVFKTVKNYEKYCQEIKLQCLTLFIKRTNDEDIAELLTKEVERKLNLRTKRSEA